MVACAYPRSANTARAASSSWSSVGRAAGLRRALDRSGGLCRLMKVYCTDSLLYCQVKHAPSPSPGGGTLVSRDSARQPVPSPRDVGEEVVRRRELAALMRPALPALVDGIVREVLRAVPVYARPGDGTYGRKTRHGVECAVELF